MGEVENDELIYLKPVTQHADRVLDSFSMLSSIVNLTSSASIRVLDATGRVVATKVVSKTEGQWLLDTRALAKGLYLYDMRDEDGELLAQGKLSLE